MHAWCRGRLREPVGSIVLWLLPLAMALTGSRASAQALSPAVSVPVSATKPGQLTVSPTVNATQTAPSIADGTTTPFGPGPVGITTQWDVKPGKVASIRLVGYFNAAGAALTNEGGDPITSGEVEAQMTTVAGMTWTPFTQAPVTAGTATVGTPGASLLFWTVAISGGNKKTSRADQLSLRLNMTGRATPLPAGTYTGTLYLRAIAF